ncbi:hypothetical protein [Deinococcus sp. YIM 77859]|uniref:hypothetical protein n=1 Tax=Deinococcus sp. YIM 77859 TaxID=1540221 RepID=UPI00055598F0|nr:hypothetical protein [Deinococcus sp. YIM 77859]
MQKYIVNGVEVDANGKPVGSTPAPDTQDVARLIAANEQLARDLAAARAAQAASLPADARERLVAVKGVGEKLADEILAALRG